MMMLVLTMIVNHISLADARFPFKRNRLRSVRCVNEKRKRLRWQAANHSCHCFERALLLLLLLKMKRLE